MKTFFIEFTKKKAIVSKLIMIGLILIFALSAFTSCKPATTGSSRTSSESISKAIVWSAVTVKDANNKDVAITKQPMRIISLPVWASEILLDVVPNERIVGISAWGDSVATSATAGKAKNIKNRVDSKNAEGIIALTPDLVILDTFNDGDGALTKTLSEAGITVLLMASPTNFDLIKGAVVTLSSATGETESGTKIVNDIDKTLNEVKAKTDTLPAADKLTVMYYENSYSNAGMLAAYGANSPFNAIATAAGLTNVCDLADYTPVDKEKVVGEWKPQVLVVPSIVYDANYSAIDEKGVTIIAAIKKDPLFTDLPAVKDNRIFALTQAYSNSTSQYMVKAVEELARAAYPSLFK